MAKFAICLSCQISKSGRAYRRTQDHAWHLSCIECEDNTEVQAILARRKKLMAKTYRTKAAIGHSDVRTCWTGGAYLAPVVERRHSAEITAAQRAG